MTNAEKIRVMTDEELANFIGGIAICKNCPTYPRCLTKDYAKCDRYLTEWLNQEVGEFFELLCQRPRFRESTVNPDLLD